MKHFFTNNRTRQAGLWLLLLFAMISPQSVWAETYIKEIKISASTDEPTAYNRLYNDGYAIVDQVGYSGVCDLNRGSGGSTAYVFLGYKTTTNPAEAITDIIMVQSSGGVGCHDEGYLEGGNQNFTYNGVRYYRVPAYGSALDCDLNRHDSNGADVTLFYTRNGNNDNGGTPIKEIYADGGTSATSPYEYVYRWYDGSLVDIANTNQGHGTYTTLKMIRHTHSLTNGICTGGHYQQPEGAGTASSPYLIDNAGKLKWFSDLTNGLGGLGLTRNNAACARLTADINMSGAGNFTPIGLYSDDNASLFSGYSGTFDGDGHTISNLHVEVTTVNGVTNFEAGFISRLLRGTVKNLVLKDITVVGHDGRNHRTGGLVGLSYQPNGNTTLVQGCAVINATLSDANNVTTAMGGITGAYASGAYNRCYTDYSKFFGSGSVSDHICCFENVSSALMTSGMLCYQLNNNNVGPTNLYRQTLNSQSYPVPTGDNTASGSTVYVTYNDNGLTIANSGTSGGISTSVNINTAAKLRDLATMVSLGYHNINATLTGNIEYKSYTTAADMIGSAAHPYSGTFNANGYTVNVAFNTNEEYAALFRYLDGATIKGRLHVTGSVTTSAKYAAGVAARLDGNASTFDEVWSQVTINSSLGSSSSHADGTHGGFVGVAATDASFTACFFDGKFVGATTKCWGGLVGWTGDGKTLTINNCYLNLDTDNNSYDANGSATWARGTSGVLTGSNNCHTFTMGSTWSAAHTLDKGDVTSGKLCWYLNGGTIDGTQKWNQRIAHSSGNDNIPVWASYRANVVCPSDNPTNDGGNTVYQGYYHGSSTLVYRNRILHTTAAPHHSASDFSNGIYHCSVCDTTIYAQPSGSGTSTDPYLIANAGNLIWFAKYQLLGNNTICAQLTADINMNGVAWNQCIGYETTAPFNGDFNGNGHKITNLNTGCGNNGKAVALFHYVGGSGHIHDLTIQDAYVSHNDARQGILVRRNYGTVERCMVIGGTLSAGSTSYVAGFAGVNEPGGIIRHCGIVGTTVQRLGSAATSYHLSSFVDYNVNGGYVEYCFAKDVNLSTNNNCWSFCANLADSYGRVHDNYYKSGTYSGTRQSNAAATLAPASWDETTILLNGCSSADNVVWRKGTSDSYPLPTGPNSGSIIYFTTNSDCSQTEYTNTAPSSTTTLSISNMIQLDNLAKLVRLGYASNLTVNLTDDIDYSPSGYSTHDSQIGTAINPFKGTFNGNGHTITVAFNTSEQQSALFRYTDGATISNLHTSGSVTSSAKFAAGVIGRNVNHATTLSNVSSDVTISSTVSGDGSHGGLVAVAMTAVTFNNCAFYGTFSGSSTTNWGGFVGWAEGTAGSCTINNSYFALNSGSNASSSNSSTFSLGSAPTLTNSYYLSAFGTAQGTTTTDAKMSSGELCYILNGNSSTGTLAWHQTIGTDERPYLHGTHGTVYLVQDHYCTGTDDLYGSPYYSNSGAVIHHRMQALSPTASTCDVQGYSRSGYQCNDCHHYFADEAGNTQLENGEILLPLARYTVDKGYTNLGTVTKVLTSGRYNQEDGKYCAGSEVTFTATVNDPVYYHFKQWVDVNQQVISTANPYTHTANSDIVLYPEYEYVFTIVDGTDNGNATRTLTECKSWASGALVIPDGVTAIGAYAFQDRSSITSIQIPSTVTSIGMAAFFGCSGLTGNITIPASVTTIGSEAFEMVPGTITLLAPYSSTDYDERAFLQSGDVYASCGAGYPDNIFVRGDNCADGGDDYHTFYETLTATNQYGAAVGSNSLCPADGGTVEVLQAPTSCGGQMTVKATPAAGYAFKYWGNATGNPISYLPEYSFNVSGLSYTIYAFFYPDPLSYNDDHTIVTGCTGAQYGQIVVPEGVVGIADNVFSQKTIYSFVLPSTLQSIGQSAFYGNRVLTSIDIPASVTSIGEDAFGYCSQLSSVTFHEGTQPMTIGNQAFRSCSALTALDIPSQVTSIGDYAFYYCSNLRNVTFHEGLQSIGQRAFQSAPIQNPTLPASLTELNYESTFSYASGTVTFKGSTPPSSGWNYGSEAFLSSSITTLRVPCGAVAAYTNVFRQTGKNYFTPTADMVYSYSVTAGEHGSAAITQQPACGTPLVATATGDQGYTLLNWTDQNGNVLGTSNPLSYSVTTDKAITANFTPGCTITATANDDSFGTVSGGGYYATGATVTLTATGTGYYHFDHWADGNTDNPRTFTASSDASYQAVFAIDRITIHAPFSPSTDHYSVTITDPNDQGNMNRDGDYWTVDYGTSVTVTATVPSYNNESYYYTFSQWSDGNTDNPRTIVATQNISNLTATLNYNPFYITDNGTKLRYYDSHCTNTTVTIPDGVTSFGYSVFEDNTTIQSVTIPEGITGISSMMFKNCTNLTTVNLPSTLTSISNDAFKGCTNLTSISLPSGLTFIGESAFEGCDLRTVNLPAGLTTLQQSAFAGNTNLTSVYINNESATGNGFQWYERFSYDPLAFAGCNSNLTIYLPCNFSTTAFSFCKGDYVDGGGGAWYCNGSGEYTITNFTPTYTYTITSESEQMGTVSIVNDSYSCEQGKQVQATPASQHHRFDGWYENGQLLSTDNPYTTPGGRDVTLVAKFSYRHSYGNPTWQWAEDGSDATLTLTCTLDPSHTLSFTKDNGVIITSAVTSAATCESAGATIYNASITYDGIPYNAPAKQVATPALGHNFVNGECTHTGCTAHQVSYLVPTYNTAGDPTSGIASWSTETAAAYSLPVSDNAVTWTAGWYYVSGNVQLSKGAVCSGAVHLILCDGANLTVSTTENWDAGILVSGDNNSLTIYAQSEGTGMGALTATGGQYGGAGIGGSNNASGDCPFGQNITINGGSVKATGGNGATGIGGGNKGSGKNIFINGGTVTANGSAGVAGIGGGTNCTYAASNIFISTTLTTKADLSANPTTVIPNNGTDLASALSGSTHRYVTIHGTHTYGEPIWSWTEDGSQATATFVCSTYGESLVFNTTTSPAVSITSAVTTAATCESAGVTTYNASVVFNGIPYTAPAKEVETAAFGHNFVNGECTHCHMRESVTYRVPTYNTSIGGTRPHPKFGIASWNESATAQNVKAVTSSEEAVTWTAGWYYVSGDDVELEQGAVCSGDVHLILCDGANLTVTNWNDYQAGINVSGDNNSLTIYAQSEGGSMGALTATGQSCAAGIGGNQNGTGQNITINGGNVTAYGDYGAASIGGGQHGSGEFITINGGEVRTEGGSGGAGIGGGSQGSGQNIYINGGYVSASGGQDAAGIGGGWSGKGSNIFINDGSVKVTGGTYYSNQADAIGCGLSFETEINASNIFINRALTIMDNYSWLEPNVIPNTGGDIASALSGNNYIFIEKIFPPAVTALSFGAESGSGTVADPYVIGEYLTVSATPDHADSGSELWVKFGEGEYTATNYMQPTASGPVTIKAKYHNSATGLDGTESEEVTVYVAVKHEVSVYGYNASLDADPAYAVEGTTVTITASIGEHYHLDRFEVTSNGVDIPFTNNGDGTFTFTMPDADVSVSADYEEDETHEAHFYVNGKYSSRTIVYEGDAIVFPSYPADICGWSFLGWADEEIAPTTTSKPSYVTSATMGTKDINYHALFSCDKGETTYYASFDLLPPSVTNLTFEGYVSGSGTEDDPYVFNEYEELSVSAEQDHNDGGSELYVDFGNGYSATNYIPINESGSITFKARYYNSSADAFGEESDEVTVYVAVKHEINVTSSYATPNADHEYAIPGTTVTLSYSDVAAHYHFVKWTSDYVELTNNADGTATFTMPDHYVSVEAEFEENETHSAYFYVNTSTHSYVEIYEGDNIEFPDDVDDICGWSLVGWTTEEDISPTTVAPSYSTSSASAKMGTGDVRYYALFDCSKSNGTTYYATTDLLPPAVTNLTFSGYESGSGTQDNPYVFYERDNLFVDAEQDHIDSGSELYVEFNGYDSNTGMTISESGSITIKARYYNEDADASGEVYETTVYVAVQHKVSLANSNYATLHADHEYAIPGTTVTLSYSNVTEHYRFVQWTSGDVELTNNTDGTATFTMPDHNVSVSATFEAIPSHVASFLVNGTESWGYVYEGDAIVFPSVADICGWSLVGWTTAIEDISPTTVEPSYVTTATMGTKSVDYQALFRCFKDGSYYYATNFLLPPSIKSFTFSGYESGSGTQDNPYVFNENNNLTVGAVQDHEDSGSVLYVRFNGGVESTTNNMQITESGFISIEARYYNSSADKYGLVNGTLVWVTVKHEISVSPSSHATLQANYEKAIPGTTVTLSYSNVADHYRFVRWTSTDVELTNNADGTATFTMPDHNVSVDAEFEEIPVYERQMAYEWGTICLPFGFNYDANNGNYKLYYPTAVTDMGQSTATLTFTELEDGAPVNIGLPLAVKAVGVKTDGKYTIRITGNTSVQTSATIIDYRVGGSDYYFNGTLQELTNQTGMYFIAQNQFWYAESPITIPANRAWLEYRGSGTAPARFTIVEAGETDITTGLTPSDSPSGGESVKVIKVMIDNKIFILRGDVLYDMNGRQVK